MKFTSPPFEPPSMPPFGRAETALSGAETAFG
jgi:hypothetical protein